MKVRIGHVNFPVRWESEDNDEYGENMGSFDAISGIEIHPDQSPSEAATTLIHEVVHAIANVYRFPPKIASEEKLCLLLEGPLAAFIRDNREVVTAIQEALENDVPFELDEVEDC